MKKELINKLFQEFESACYQVGELECWSARDLQKLLGYKTWKGFKNAILKAVKSCEQSGEKVEDHFVGMNSKKMLSNGAHKIKEDVALTRYACYLVALNGSPNKSEVAFAHTYFAIQTRKQELIEKRLLEVERIHAREKLSKTEKVLSGILFERDVNGVNFALIRSEGDKAFFGGRSTKFMKTKMDIPENRALADFLPTLLIKAKDFATELTNYNVVDKDMEGRNQISKEHTANNTEVRKILIKRGLRPEKLPAAEDVKKIKRRIEKEEKKMVDRLKNEKD